jgi:hypothetical protein
MMQAHYPESFEREAGCTEAEWLMWLPGAVGEARLQLAPGGASVEWEAGLLQLTWHALEPRRIALIRVPRLYVSFRFVNTPADARHRFMRHFDLFMQRGGG